MYNLEISIGDGDFTAPGSPPGTPDYGRNIRQCSAVSCSDDNGPCQNDAYCLEVGASI